MVLAHVAGIPLEETLLGAAPVALTCLGLAAAWMRAAVSRRPARRGARRP
jgi:predicted alpha/beta-hydrolase family hydrolase